MSRYATGASIVLLFVLSAATVPALAGNPLAMPDRQSFQAAPSEAKAASQAARTAGQIHKVKQEPLFEGVARLDPSRWWARGSLPWPEKGQFGLSGNLIFGRVRGELTNKPPAGSGVTQYEVLKMEDLTGVSRSPQSIWTVSAQYRVRPRWTIRYAYTPMMLDGTTQVTSAFSFGGQYFVPGDSVRARWERQEHRFGLLLDVKRTLNGTVGFYADWRYLEDSFSVGRSVNYGNTPTPSWTGERNLAVLGLELEKGLADYRGTSLALKCKGGVSFLSDTVGYEGEVGLGYVVPVSSRRYGFLRGGYRYTELRREQRHEVFKDSSDGAFIEAGFVF
ncbi:MAG: hypothetical protein V2B18_15430 [Pseudomonadota bacterium]